MEVRVELPPGELIEYWAFCKAIAQAVSPADERGLEGVACIEAKMVRRYAAMPPPARNGAPSLVSFQSVLVSDDGRTLDQLFGSHDDETKGDGAQMALSEPAHLAITEMELPDDLKDTDRLALEEVLPKLPTLRYPVSEEEAVEFMSAYFDLKDHPPWTPILVTSATIERRKARQNEIMRRHQQALKKEFTLGRLNAVDSNHVSVAELLIGCYFPREQAIAYLTRNGMGYCDQELERVPSNTVLSRPEVTHAELSTDKNTIIKKKLSAKVRQELVEFHAQCEKNDIKNYTEQTAKKFGVSPSYVRRLRGMNKRQLLLSEFSRTQKG